MNISNTIVETESVNCQIGDSPAVCLTQDLPPEQDAHILLLGCGDARNVLLTCFSDSKRKMDITCCDVQPAIHARNVLLYTLFIDDRSNLNIESIWNIYYNWKIDENSVKLLESQAQKLLQISSSVDQWHNATYGSIIRFCDENSLVSIRSFWTGFTSKGHQSGQLEAAIDLAKTLRKRKKSSDGIGYRSTFPTSIDKKTWGVLSEITKRWWDCGVLPSSSSSVNPMHFNPALLYAPTATLPFDLGVSPLGGIPLSTAFTSIKKESVFYLKNKSTPVENVVNCAKNHFAQWASAFRRAVKNGLVIRIFSGDAFAFCFTLRNCQQTGSTSMNLFCHMSTSVPLVLHHSDYGRKNSAAPLSNGNTTPLTNDNAAPRTNGTAAPRTNSNAAPRINDNTAPLTNDNTAPLTNGNVAPLISSNAASLRNVAPLSFDIIDASNLADNLGPLNVIALASSLLKHHVSSCLYTELMNLHDATLEDRVTQLFGVDVRSMALLLGLVPLDLFTNATNCIEELPSVCNISQSVSEEDIEILARSRLRWKRAGVLSRSSFIQAEAKELAEFLIKVHNAMFKFKCEFDNHSYSDSLFSFDSDDSDDSLYPSSGKNYNQSGFAFLLSILKGNVMTDWNACIKDVYSGILRANLDSEDLVFNMHVFGVDDSLFTKPKPLDLQTDIVASILPKCKHVPDQLCVTFRVPRKDLQVFKFTGISVTLQIILSFEARDLRKHVWTNSFSSVQIMFGKKHELTEKDNLLIEEDSAHLSGSSDMYVSAMVPTSMLVTMLLKSKDFIPKVRCGFRHSLLIEEIFEDLGDDLCFSSRRITDKERVFVTRFMPGMPALPKFNFNNRQSKATSDTTVVHFSENGLKIKSVVKRLTLKSKAAKAKLAIKSTPVDIVFTSPLTAFIGIGGASEFKVEFPVPVSVSKYKLKIDRKSSFVDVQSCFFEPVEEDAPTFLFPCVLTKTTSGIVPAPWTSTRVDLDVMPLLNINDSQGMSWLQNYLFMMFSARENHTRLCQLQSGYRIDLKDRFVSLITQCAEPGPGNFFGFRINRANSRLHTVVLPSCLRLDLASYTVVLDCALIPVTNAMLKDPVLTQFLKKLNTDGLCKFNVRDAENLAWKAMMPSFVERCRTWKHEPDCEYVQVGEVPLSRGLDVDGLPSICSCGIGEFPANYLQNLKKSFPTLDDILNRYATRAAISPVFAVPYVEDCDTECMMSFNVKNEKCEKCGSAKKKNAKTEQSLIKCTKCELVSYCSVECQKADWKTHKPFCKAT